MKQSTKIIGLVFLFLIINGFVFLVMWKEKNCFTVRSLDNSLQIYNVKMKDGYIYDVVINRVENFKE